MHPRPRRLSPAFALTVVAATAVLMFVDSPSLAYVVDLEAHNPDFRRCSGFPVGITDSAGKRIIPPKYSRIDYLGHGIFMAWGIDPKNKWICASDRHIFDKDGNELDLHLPAGATALGILSFGAQSEADADIQLSSIPSDALIRIARDGKFGICDGLGNTVLDTKYLRISTGSGDLVSLTSDERDNRGNQKQFAFNVRTRELTTLSPTISVWDFEHSSEGLIGFGIHERKGCPRFIPKSGYKDLNGKVVIGPRFFEAGPFVNGVATVRVFTHRAKHDTQRRTINRKGVYVSPADMDVEQFYGHYAVARSAFGNDWRRGVVNRKFEYVITPQYDEIEPLSSLRPGFKSASAPSRYRDDPKLFIAKNGPNAVALSPQGKAIFRFPEGFCNITYSGDGVLRAHNCHALSTECLYFNLSGTLIAKTEEPHLEYENNDTNKWMPFNRVRITVGADDGRFDSERWTHYWMTRSESWSRFLKDFNLIGMDKTRIAAQLGPGSTARFPSPKEHLMFVFGGPPPLRATSDSVNYPLTSGGCTPDSGLFVQLTYEHNKLVSWCFAAGNRRSEEYKTNMVFNPVGLLDTGFPSDKFQPMKPKAE